jgi:ATP diphosphatase
MHTLDNLLQLMRDLRDPKHGCPWDQKQDHASIVSHTIEEAYEVADAIERNDTGDLKQELGDLLFQVVFYAQLSAEKKDFDFDDVVNAITSKLLRRHPHVFPDGSLSSAGVAE